MSGANGKAPQIQTKMEVSQLRTPIDPDTVTQTIVQMARQGYEHYSSTLIPAGIARGVTMGAQFDLLHFFRRVTHRKVEVPESATDLPDDSARLPEPEKKLDVEP